MSMRRRGLSLIRSAAPVAFLALLLCPAVMGGSPKYRSRVASVNGVKIHYLTAGSGPRTLVLIHGFGETSRMWLPAFEAFGKDYTIIAPDLRGIGDSSRPQTGYDKKTIAADVHELVRSLDKKQIYLVG